MEDLRDRDVRLTPKQQIKMGLTSDEIICPQVWKLVFHPDGKSPSCVKLPTFQKLLDRGWKSISQVEKIGILSQEERSEIKNLWETDPYFSQPESVLYDSKRNVLYVSNINGEPDEQNGMGFLSKLALDGKIIESHWIEGLDAPKGMAIFDDKLYVSDLTSLVEIELERNKISNRYYASESVFLNDVTADSAGNIYVSDTFADTIYRLHEGIFETWLQTPELKNPNGLLVDNSRLIVGSWGVMDEDFTTDIPGHLMTIDLENKAISNIGDGSSLAIS